LLNFNDFRAEVPMPKVICGAAYSRKDLRRSLILWIEGSENRIQPKLPELGRCCFQRLGMLVSRSPQGGHGDSGMVQFAGVADVPAFKVSGRYLRVKLQSQREISNDEGLMRVAF